MYKIGDKVMHQSEGACYINDIVTIAMDNEDKEYYRLTPLLNESACIYISVKKHSSDRVRPIISDTILKETEDLISTTEPEWVDDAKKRLKFATDTLHSFDFIRNTMLIKSFLVKNKEKQLSAKDKQLLQTAQKLVYSEIAIKLDQEYSSIEDKMDDYYLNS